MKNPKISIIVPVYNAEQYLKSCVGSILEQTYKNFELILVDDGSPDGCPAMCDEFAKQDRRVVAIHKKNGGVSSARNLGMEKAGGKYITFIDSDDFVSNTYLEYFNEAKDDDYVVSGYYSQNNNFEWIEHKQSYFKTNIDEIHTSPDLINSIPTGMICGRRYKTDIIRKNNLCFEDGMKRGEDVLFNTNYLSQSKSVTVLQNANYFYRSNPLSATSFFEPKLFEWSMKSVLKIGEIIGKNNDLFLRRVWNNAMYVCDGYFATAKGTNLKIQLSMMRCVFKVCRDKYVRKSLLIVRDNTKKALMIKFYIYPFLPYIYYIYKKIRH